MKKLFILCLFMLIFVPIHSQETTENEKAVQEQASKDLAITKINFTGLKKTSTSYIQSRVKKFIGNKLTDSEIHELETELQLEGLFNEIKIETEQISETEAQINVKVTEKITFIPIPFAMYSSSNYLAGAIVMDTNAFGRKDMFMIGGFFASNAKTGMASFSKQPKDNWVPGFSIFALGSIFTPEYRNSDEEKVLKYNDSYYNIKLTVSEKLAQHFTFTTGFGYEDHSITEHEDYKNIVLDPIKIGMLSFSLGYSDSDWNGIFMSTNSAKINAEFGLTNSENSDYKHPVGYSFEIGEQHPIFIDTLRFYQKYSGYYGKNLPIAVLKGASSASVAILSGHFNSSKLIGGNMGLEYAIKKFNWGMISIYGDYQAVYAKNFAPAKRDGDFEFMHGASGGTKFYLAKIAIPALAIGGAYNITKRYWQYSFALGATF